MDSDIECASVADHRVAISDDSCTEDDVADVGLAAVSIAGLAPGVVAVAKTPAKYASQSGQGGTIRRYEHTVC